MPKISEIYRTKVYGSTGRRLGVVADVLFDPTQPRVVGFLVRRTPFLLIIKLKPRFAPWPEGQEVAAGAPLRLTVPKLLSPSQADRALGHDWEDSVVWRSMMVTDRDGTLLGSVKDVGFGRKNGWVLSLTLSEGGLMDSAVGTATVPGDAVIGFDGSTVVVDSDKAEEEGTSGGAAKVAAAAFVTTKMASERAVDIANAALEESAVVKAAAEKIEPEKIGRTLGGWYRSARKAADKAMDDLDAKSGQDS
jgi:sporulation protein YlmC with PRC-barrel domain